MAEAQYQRLSASEKRDALEVVERECPPLGEGHLDSGNASSPVRSSVRETPSVQGRHFAVQGVGSESPPSRRVGSRSRTSARHGSA